MNRFREKEEKSKEERDKLPKKLCVEEHKDLKPFWMRMMNWMSDSKCSYFCNNNFISSYGIN